MARIGFILIYIRFINRGKSRIKKGILKVFFKNKFIFFRGKNLEGMINMLKKERIKIFKRRKVIREREII